MITLISIFLNLILILIIFLQLPTESLGLSSSLTSPFSVNRFLDYFILILIVIYFIIAIQLNILNDW